MAENQYGFPTEVLSLPSQGLLYPEGSPLRSGTIDVKYMTAKEEDILTSTNLIQKGLVIDKLLESVVVQQGVNIDDMLIGDKNALMVGTRILGYGKEYRTRIMNPDTSEYEETTIDLTQFNHKKVDTELYKNGNLFSYTLPNSNRLIEFKLMTGFDEKNIKQQLKDYEKAVELTGVSNELTTRLKYQIQSVDGNKEQSFIDNFVDNEFLALDTKAYRKHYGEVSPDIDMIFDFTNKDGKTTKVDVPLGIDFFWPAGE